MTPDRDTLARLATLTLNRGEGEWLPYEETWYELANGVLALLAEITRLEDDEAEMSAHYVRLQDEAEEQRARAERAEAERDKLREVLETVADQPCRIFPTPPPRRLANGTRVYPSNCITQKIKVTCDSCAARDALAAGGET